MITRVDSCRRRLLDYCAGKIEKIEELEEELIPVHTRDVSYKMNDYDMLATASTLWGNQ